MLCVDLVAWSFQATAASLQDAEEEQETEWEIGHQTLERDSVSDKLHGSSVASERAQYTSSRCAAFGKLQQS